VKDKSVAINLNEKDDKVLVTVQAPKIGTDEIIYHIQNSTWHLFE
jgi:hypothetical protein